MKIESRIKINAPFSEFNSELVVHENDIINISLKPAYSSNMYIDTYIRWDNETQKTSNILTLSHFWRFLDKLKYT